MKEQNWPSSRTDIPCAFQSVVTTIALIAAAPVSVPMLVSVGAGVAVGIGASALANWACDALPDSATDPVDDFVADAWDGAQNMA